MWMQMERVKSDVRNWCQVGLFGVFLMSYQARQILIFVIVVILASICVAQVSANSPVVSTNSTPTPPGAMPTIAPGQTLIPTVYALRAIPGKGVSFVWVP